MTVGPNRTCAPFAFASTPRALPTALTNLVSHEAASPVAAGKQDAGTPYLTYVIKAEARRWLVGSITLKELSAADSIRAIGCPSFILSVLENPFKLKTDLRLGIPSLGTGDVCH